MNVVQFANMKFNNANVYLVVMHTRTGIEEYELEMLSPKQIGHLIALEDWWKINYADEEDIKEFEKFKAFIEAED